MIISRVGRSCKNDQTNIITNLIRPTQKVANLKDKIASLQKQLVATITGDFQITVFQYALRWTTIFQGDSLILTDVREYIYEAC